MGLFDNFKKYQEKKAGAAEPEKVAVPVSTYDREELPVTDIDNPSVADTQNMSNTTGEAVQSSVSDSNSSSSAAQLTPVVTTPSWINAGSYEAAAKQDPNISRGQYAYELSKYRREQGQPDLSYTEWSNIIKGQDPYETEAERQKRERQMKTAKILTGVGSVLGNLVNYVRAKNGHVAMNLDSGAAGYNRLDRIRQGQDQLARSRAKDYLGAMAQDRAERAKAEAAAASAQKAERDYQFKVKELEFKIENAKTEGERKNAELELKKVVADRKEELDRAKLEETKRNNDARNAILKARVEKQGSGTKKYLELQTNGGTKRYTPDEYGNNWIHRAYQDMLKDATDYAQDKFGDSVDKDGKKSWENYVDEFKVAKKNMWGSSTPSEQEMYEAITKYNNRMKQEPWHIKASYDDVPENERYDD